MRSSPKQSKTFEDLKYKLMQEEAGERLKRQIQLIDLEKRLYEERIATEKEKRREAKAQADIAELELERLKQN